MIFLCYNGQDKERLRHRKEGDYVNLLKKYKHTWIIPVYGIFYLTAFQYLEQRDVRPHIIHMKIDDYIPFCEYFIVPYLLWFAYIAVTVLYFSLFNDSKREFYQLIFTLGVGMTLFLVISYIYPNGQDLRPKLTGDSIFIELVRHLYRIDTPTNILPSIHVFNSVACCTAVFKNAKARKHPVLLGGTLLLTILIILATVFLKQHTLVDVVAAFALNVFCYQMFYKEHPARQKQPAFVK